MFPYTDKCRKWKCIQEKGGKVLIQMPSSAEVSCMPQQALKEIKADAVLSTEKIAELSMQ
jgi:chemotaxis response regulator CheB